MIEAGSRLSTRTFGPWITWTAAGRPEADPYTRAHTARNGLLPVSSTLELTFRAKTDSRGGRLTSSCDYTIVLQDPSPPGGALPCSMARAGWCRTAPSAMPSTSARPCASRTAATAIGVARDARPGNWLPSGRSGRIVLVLTVQDAAFAASVHDGGQAKALPEIQRTGCR